MRGPRGKCRKRQKSVAPHPCDRVPAAIAQAGPAVTFHRLLTFIQLSQSTRKVWAFPEFQTFKGLTMSDMALPGSIEPAAHKGPDLSGAFNPLTAIIFAGAVAAVLLFVAYSIYTDVEATGAKVTSYRPSSCCSSRC